MKYLRKYKINEGIGIDNKYSVEIKPVLYYNGLIYKGDDNPDITCNPIKITFNIDMEIKEYGIKSIIVYNANGPEQAQLYVRYYDENNIEQADDVMVDLDWSLGELVDYPDANFISIHQVEIYLKEENGVIKQDTQYKIEIAANSI